MEAVVPPPLLAPLLVLPAPACWLAAKPSWEAAAAAAAGVAVPLSLPRVPSRLPLAQEAPGWNPFRLAEIDWSPEGHHP